MPTQFTLLPRVSPFLPEIVRALLDTSAQPMTSPWSLQFEGAVVRVLIDGFTGLSETFAERPNDGERLMAQAAESYFGERVEVVYAFGGSTVLIDGHGMVLLFPAAPNPEARFLAGRAALGACLLMRGQAGPGRARTGARGPSLESRIGVSFGEVTLGAAGSRPWHVVLAGTGLEGADTAALTAQSGEVMATDALLAWVGTVRTEGTFHRGMASITALPPPDDRLEPTLAGLKSGGDELLKRIMATLAPEVKDWAESGDAAFPSRFEPATLVHIGIDGLGVLGENKPVEKLHILVERAVTIADEWGGRVETATIENSQSWLYLVFAGGGTDEGRIRGALHAALELRRALRLPFVKGVRVGLSSGAVFRAALGGPSRRQLGVLGPPVEEAARLAALAAPGQILVDEESRERAGGLFEFEAQTVRTTATGQKAREHMKRTQSREVQVLVRSLDPLRRTVSETPMVGRAVELALCESALLDAAAGRGAAFALRGARGMGKTKLLKELASRAKGMQVTPIWVQCRPQTDPMDLAPLRDLLGRLRGDEGLAAAAAPGQVESDVSATQAQFSDPRELARDLATALRLRSNEGPLLLILEDLDLASPLARGLAGRMGTMLATLAVVLILTDASLPGAADSGPELIEMPPLSPEEIEELSVHVMDGRSLAPELLEAVGEGSGGNPLHLIELLRALDSLPTDQQTPDAVRAIPSSLQDVVLWRFERLELELQETLKLAASLQFPSSLDALRAAHPDPGRLSEHLSRLGARGFPLPISGQTDISIRFGEPFHLEVLRTLGGPSPSSQA